MSGFPSVSVIVAVYNAQDYLEKCLDSIIAQECKAEFEVILIDDGSADQSSIICQRYCKVQNNFSYHKKENEGLWTVRNLGLSLAKGSFICFVDSDDYLDKSLLADNLALVERENADVIVFGFTKQILTKQGQNTFTMVPPDNSVITSRPFLDSVIRLLDSGCGLTVWNQIWRKEFLVSNKIWFPSMRRGADMYFLLDAYKNLPRITFNRNAYYFYIAIDHSTKRDSEILQNHLRIFRNYLSLTSAADATMEYKRYTIKLFNLWFCHVIPNSIYRTHSLTTAYKIKLMREVLSNSEVVLWLKEMNIGDANNLLAKIMLIVMKARNAYLLFLFTVIKDWVKRSFVFNYRRLA